MHIVVTIVFVKRDCEATLGRVGCDCGLFGDKLVVAGVDGEPGEKVGLGTDGCIAGPDWGAEGEEGVDEGELGDDVDDGAGVGNELGDGNGANGGGGEKGVSKISTML